MSVLLIAAVIVFVSLLFAVTNGIHDSSSMVATPISCEAMSPRVAVVFASVVGFAGAMLGGSAVSNTVSSIISLPADSNLLPILLASVLSATIWNLVTLRVRLPSSSTHALIGGMVGAAVAASGTSSVHWGWSELTGSAHRLDGVTLVVVFLLMSILIGFLLGLVIQALSRQALKNATKKANVPIRRAQLLTAALLAFGHGANDTQKQMGIITLGLIAAGYASSSEGIPFWVRTAAALMMAVGTVGGGWGIMKTLGSRIFKLEPIHSLSSQIASSSSLAVSTLAGAPVSSTQVVASSIIGVGTSENPKRVQWSVGKEIVAAFLMTIPAAMALSAILYYALDWML
jgi:PiT family inorganic phosphate transporter